VADMRCMLVLALIFSTGISFSQSKVLSSIPKKGRNVQSFIPVGYDTLSTTLGDLNKDKSEDAVLVLRHEKENVVDLENTNVDSIPSRLLVVLLRKGNAYELAAVSDSAVLCKHCGGIMGDPFQGISIEKGIIVINHYGGSAWRWGYTHKFRFQQNDYFIIGKTKISYWNVEMCEKLNEFAATEYEDINFVTGAFEKKKISQEGCKLLLNKKGKAKIKPLVRLGKFSIDN
jgi:hypothetical protein